MKRRVGWRKYPAAHVPQRPAPDLTDPRTLGDTFLRALSGGYDEGLAGDWVSRGEPVKRPVAALRAFPGLRPTRPENRR